MTPSFFRRDVLSDQARRFNDVFKGPCSLTRVNLIGVFEVQSSVFNVFPVLKVLKCSPLPTAVPVTACSLNMISVGLKMFHCKNMLQQMRENQHFLFLYLTSVFKQIHYENVCSASRLKSQKLIHMNAWVCWKKSFKYFIL